MNRNFIILGLAAMTVAAVASCTKADGLKPVTYSGFETNAVFNISISELSSQTKVTTVSKNSTQLGLSDDVAFGLIGVNPDNGAINIDNMGVYACDGVRSADIVSERKSANTLVLNAYYPLAKEYDCRSDGTSVISFTEEDVQFGPMVSNYVTMDCGQESNVIYFDFHHIANLVGFKVCDITPDEQLRNHIHVRKIQLCGVSVKGDFVNNTETSYWIPQHTNDPVVIFEGNEKVGYGLDASKYVMSDGLSDNIEDANRFTIIPEYLGSDKYIEAVLDIDEFEYDGIRYHATAGRVERISFAGAIPDDSFDIGLPYLFTLGLNLEDFYRPIDFTAGVDEFKGKILEYENE